MAGMDDYLNGTSYTGDSSEGGGQPMSIDDNGNSSGKKRKAILNKNYKYIGISHKYIGNKFIAYFSFSK